MEPDVIEIPPPPSRPKRPKLNQVMQRDVIEIDDDEDALDVMIIDEKIDTKNKGKAIEDNASVHYQTKMKEALGDYSFYPPECSIPGSHQPIIGDGFSSDLFNGSASFDFFSEDFMDFDEYSYLQAHFDNVDIPPGVEAPIPSLLDSVHKPKNTHNQCNLNALDLQALKDAERSKKLASVSNSASLAPLDSGNASKAHLQSFWSSLNASQSMRMQTVPQHGIGSASPTAHIRKRTPVTSKSPSNHKFASQLPEMPNFFHSGALYAKSYAGLSVNNVAGNPFWSSYPAPAELDNIITSSMDLHKSKIQDLIAKYPMYSSPYPTIPLPHDLPDEGVARSPRNVNEDDILRKYQIFKQFDTVEDHSDHHYASSGSRVKQPPKNWAKRIQEEWRILGKDLPDSIYVRVYESRMDLLRACIIGAEGTPYHDGLFFFDVFFPSGYPNVPPNVHYHSGGLRLNPNLYNCGKVCLSLLGTWHGNKNEKWQPGVSTVLQVLVSIQALILNRKPYFNEPGYARMSGSATGEKRSQEYNEKTFMLSLKTMVYSMRRPPKHFEDFVVGHFHKYGRDIVVACKAYMEGAPMGCLVKGGVQDVEEGAESCSEGFKGSLQPHVEVLVKELGVIGVKNCEELQAMAKRGNNQVRMMATFAM